MRKAREPRIAHEDHHTHTCKRAAGKCYYEIAHHGKQASRMHIKFRSSLEHCDYYYIKNQIVRVL